MVLASSPKHSKEAELLQSRKATRPSKHVLLDGSPHEWMDESTHRTSDAHGHARSVCGHVSMRHDALALQPGGAKVILTLPPFPEYDLISAETIVLTIPDTAALIEAVKMLGESERLVDKLWGNVDYLRKGFTERGFDIGHSETPIIPVMIGDEDLARAFSARLFEEGVFASPIVFPMVAKGKARVRVIVSASFSQDDCDAGLAAFGRVAGELLKP